MNTRKGAALLDREYPEWFKAIDLDGLDMISGTSCVLGQLGEHEGIGHYSAMANELGLNPLIYLNPADPRPTAYEYGFNLEGEWTAAVVRAWNQAWKRAIRYRLKKAGA